MRRVRLGFAAGAALLLGGCERSGNDASPARGQAASSTGAGPRLLLMTWDTTRADHLAAYGGKARTPAFDELAARGVLYERTWSSAPLTLPSHTSLLTGVLPTAHGVRENAIFEATPSALLLSEVLHDAGFKTGAFVGCFVLDAKFGLDQGFDAYDSPDSSRIGTHKGVVERPASAVADAALAWIDALGPDDRFFLWVHFYDPHSAHVAPPDLAREGADPYDLEIEDCDRQLARIQARLRERGLDRGLLTVVTSDHGESLEEHGERTHGTFLYDATMRVPLVVSPAPVGATPGTRVVAPVCNVDVAAHVLDRLGVGRASLPDARSPPLPTTAAEEGAPELERALLLDSFGPYYTRRWSPLRAVVWRGFKYVSAPRPELYRLESDPRETRDLAGEQPELAGRMRARLAALVAENPPLHWNARNEATPDDARRLEQLGYATFPAAGVTGDEEIPEGLPDPKDRIGDIALRDEVVDLIHQGSALLGLDGMQSERAPGEEAKRRALGVACFEKARAVLDRLRANNPDDFAPGTYGPMIDLALKSFDTAATGFEKLVAQNPRNPSNHHNLATCYLRLGHPDWAQREMEKAMFLDPNALFTNRWLVEFTLGTKDWAAAAWWLDEMAKRTTIEPAELQRTKNRRAEVQKQLDMLRGQPRPPRPVEDADLVPEGRRAPPDAGR
jgi:arylsulfatase A-like enzyme